MNFRKLGYGYTKEIPGRYESERLYVEAELEKWEDPRQSLDNLRGWVHGELELRAEVRDLRAEKSKLVVEIEDLRDNLQEAKTQAEGIYRHLKAEWESARNLLAQHGFQTALEFPEFPDVRIPF